VIISGKDGKTEKRPGRFPTIKVENLFLSYEELQEILKGGASKLRIFLTPQHVSSFYRYLEELSLWNKRINLVSRVRTGDIVYKDFLDSLTISKYLDSGVSMADLGSGAGFPGIPIKIIRQDVPVSLFEVNRKKIYFLQHIVRCLGLEGIEVHWEQGRRSKEAFDVVVSRAFGTLTRFMAEGISMLKPTGILLAMKGNKGEEELEETRRIMKKMGFNLLFCDHFKLPFLEHERTVIGLQKN
jgi:16S rRNA (guanine527-N7)-methyltransferase